MTLVLEWLLEATDPENYSSYLKKVDALLTSNGRLDDQAVSDVFDIMKSVRQNLLDQMSQVAGDSTEFSAAQLRGLRDAIDAAAVALNQRLQADMRDNVVSSWDRGVDQTDTLISTAGGNVQNLPLQVSVDQLVVAQQVASDLVTKVSSDFRQQANRIIQMGTLGSVSPYQMMQQVSQLLKTEPTRADSSLGSTATQAERIVRTEMNAVYSLSSQMRQAQFEQETPGNRKIWITAHDARVRFDHISAGARYAPGSDPGPIRFDDLYRVGGEGMSGPHDPGASARQRINCRCISIMYRPEWFTAEAETTALPTMPEPAPSGADLQVGDKAIVRHEGSDLDGKVVSILETNVTLDGKVYHEVDLGTPYRGNYVPVSWLQPLTAEEALTGAAVRASMLAWDKAQQTKIEALQNQWADIQARYNKLTHDFYNDVSIEELRFTNPDQYKAERDAFYAKEDKLAAQLKDVSAKRKAATQDRIDAIREKFIYQADPASEDQIGLRLPADQDRLDAHVTWQQGYEAFKKVVGSGFFTDGAGTPYKIGLRELPKGSRAYAQYDLVHITPDEPVSIVVHEMAHTLEHLNLPVQQSRRSFYDRRTQGESLQPLSKVTGINAYEDTEVTRPDRFIDAYMGKDYGTTPHSSSDRASEMVSMGVQMLYEDPIRLATQDPDYFDWIYDLLHKKGK